MRTDPPSPNEMRAQLTELLQAHEALAERLRQGQAAFQRIARSVWRVQEEERSRFARELHDGVGHNLAAMLHLISEALASLPDDERNRHARDELARAHAIGDSTLQDTRALSRMLRPQILDDLGLEPALRWLARSFSETHGIDTQLDYHAPPAGIDADRSTLVFRLVQEALANTARHASARRVAIAFDGRGEQASLRVRDDGSGCDIEAALARGRQGASSGLGGMRDRVRLFGGSLQFQSTPGAGFGLSVHFPLSDASPGASP
ncbi:sensor histidine kinase [Dokdonella fugitiva]|uniref:sensor histidine kinase n=1 Tax=Dokdonella fugitiva TaxID=328517 RepID=UPI0015FD6FAB|nr:sensor histidine kinase [Dokdonella fugitiva]MBA8884533.1 signal transduction histidine kinase [Dokdonella fugitiva]